MTSNPIDSLVAKFVKAEPAIAASGAAAVVGYALTALTTHGVISGVRASSLSQALIPPSTAVMLLVLGFVLRRVVMPAAAAAERIEAEVAKRLAASAIHPATVGAILSVAASGDSGVDSDDASAALAAADAQVPMPAAA